MNRPAVLFFDLDRTLWDFERNSMETLKGLYADCGLAEKGEGGFEDFLSLIHISEPTRPY